MTATSSQPIIGLTMGDPAGIGAEILVKALADHELWNQARFVIYGMNELLVHAADLAGIKPYWWRTSATASRLSDPSHHRVVVVDYDDFSTTGHLGPEMPGPSRRGGDASLAFLNDAVHDAMAPEEYPARPDALVTAPICKASWGLAGLKRFPGHTEFLAERTRAKRYGMMFVAPRLRVILATTHVPLMEIRNLLTIGCVFNPIDLGDRALRELFAVERPRIAVCGLNPHASEGGLFGDEEYRVIEPAIRQANELGIDASGPYSADTIFNAAVGGKYDLVVAMYHDQGLIPVKLLARDEAVNLTVGLPVIRTSPDHGVAFDIAGQNRANPGSMRAAIDLAIRLANRRRAHVESGSDRP